MISTPQNWSDWRRLSSDACLSKRHFFHFFTIHVKCCFYGISALLVNGSVCHTTHLPIDTYRQTHKKGQHRLMLSYYRQEKMKITGCLPCPYILLNFVSVGLKTMSVSLHGFSFGGSCYVCRSAKYGKGFGIPCLFCGCLFSHAKWHRRHRVHKSIR